MLHISRYKACSADAAKCFLTVRDVDLAVNHILDDAGNVSDSKCLAVKKNMFPLKAVPAVSYRSVCTISES